MAKINIKEFDIKRIIRHTISETLGINISDVDDFDIESIDINILKQGYVDLRLIPTPTFYDDILSDLPHIKEAIGDIVEPDIAMLRIRNKYGIPSQFFRKVEANNKIYIYIVTARVGINDKLIINDMQKLGYFLGRKGHIRNVKGMQFQVLQFEPTYQLQEDITDRIKEKYNSLFHWTPLYNINNIKTKGLIPQSINKHFSYPPRIYLINGNADDKQIYHLGQELCIANDDKRNDGEYVLLTIKTQALPDNVRLYYDPNSRIGIYTEQPIPYNAIIDKTKQKFIQKYEKD